MESSLLGYAANLSGAELAFSFIAWVLGVTSHFLKKCVREKVGFVQYWMEHKPSSIASLITGLMSLATILIYFPNPDLITVFSAGYITDSVVNKPKK